MATRSRTPDPGLFHRIDLNLLKIFREIAHAKGIAAAARRLNVQQPAVSLALKRLEGHLGSQLCLRNAHGIELTQAGRIVAELGNRLFDEVHALPPAIAEAEGAVEGLLTIRAVSGVVSSELDATLDSIRRRYPGIRLRIDVAPCRIVVDSLLRGQAEICIAFAATRHRDLHYAPLVREFQQLYCSASHALFGASVDNPEMLSPERFVLTGSDEPEDVDLFRRRYGLGDLVSGEAENLEETKRLILAGVGIGFLPTILAERDGGHATLWPLLPRHMLPNYLVYLITRPEAQQTLPTQVFLREIRRRLDARGTPI